MDKNTPMQPDEPAAAPSLRRTPLARWLLIGLLGLLIVLLLVGLALTFLGPSYGVFSNIVPSI